MTFSGYLVYQRLIETYTQIIDSKSITEASISMKKIVLRKQGIVLGEYGCKGYNTYGPWEFIDRINKDIPKKKK